MKIKLVVVDLELSRGARRGVSAVAVALLAVGAGAVASASVPKSWSDGDTLTAGDLNGNFAALDGRVTTLEAPRSAVLAHKDAAQTIAANSAAVLTFASESFDVNNEFSPTTGAFTPNLDGYYQVECHAIFNGADSGCVTIDVLQDGNSMAESVTCGPLGAQTISVSAVIHMTAASVATCSVANQLATDETVGGTQPWEIARDYVSITRVQ